MLKDVILNHQLSSEYTQAQEWAYLGFHLVCEGYCSQFPGTSCSSDCKLSNGGNIAAIYLVFYNPHFEK